MGGRLRVDRCLESASRLDAKARRAWRRPRKFPAALRVCKHGVWARRGRPGRGGAGPRCRLLSFVWGAAAVPFGDRHAADSLTPQPIPFTTMPRPTRDQTTQRAASSSQSRLTPGEGRSLGVKVDGLARPNNGVADPQRRRGARGGDVEDVAWRRVMSRGGARGCWCDGGAGGWQRGARGVGWPSVFWNGRNNAGCASAPGPWHCVFSPSGAMWPPGRES
jgi:hypothetical protein